MGGENKSAWAQVGEDDWASGEARLLEDLLPLGMDVDTHSYGGETY